MGQSHPSPFFPTQPPPSLLSSPLSLSQRNDKAAILQAKTWRQRWPLEFVFILDDAQSCSTSSGYQSEDISANEVPIDSSGLPITEDDDASTGHEIPDLIADQLLGKSGSELLEKESYIMPDEESIPVDLPNCIVKCKSAFKWKLCPRVVCLNEKSLRAHLKGMPRKKSKRQDKNGSKKRTRYGG
ncbi:hypothetical protein COP2_034932 [Malus domestica]